MVIFPRIAVEHSYRSVLNSVSVYLCRSLKMAKVLPDPAKVQLRKEIADRIASLTAEEKERQSRNVYEKLITHPWYKSSGRIALFMSTEHEVDTAPIIAHIQARGASAFVPQYAGGRMRMLHVEPDDDNNMSVTKHGIAQHSKDQIREDALDAGLDLIVAPGVAFSKTGARLGHGGGYYDRYLAHLRSDPQTAPKVIALAFSCQIVDHVPTSELDQKVDEVLYAD